MKQKPDDSLENQQRMPSGAIRLILSSIIMVYLCVVLIGPMSNPIGSTDFTTPLARTVAPLHQALFLGHGYRFFGPDPSPSHILEYRIESAAESEPIAGKFPDREIHSPRLLYHRWFMLSESIYSDQVQLIDDQEYQEVIQQLAAEIEAVRLRGELANARALIAERDQLAQNQIARKSRSDRLLNHLAQYLLNKHGGESIEIFLRERLIAAPSDIASRIRLNHPRFLSEPRSIGKFTADVQAGELESIE